MLSCTDLAIPHHIMQHVVRVESSGNPYAIGVVNGKLQRQPRNLSEAVSTAKMLEQKGYNFSLGLAQVNRYNLKKYGLHSYEHAFQTCANLKAGSQILKECYDRSKDWGKSFSCYYSGNFVTGYKHGYVQKIFASMGRKSSNTKIAVSRLPSVGSGSSAAIRSYSAPSTMTAYNNTKKATPIIESVASSKDTGMAAAEHTAHTHTDSAFVF